MIAVQVTSLLKKLPKRLWRAVHMSSYGIVWLAVVHAGTAGTDATNRVYQFVGFVLTSAAISAVVLRLVLGRRGSPASS